MSLVIRECRVCVAEHPLGGKCPVCENNNRILKESMMYDRLKALVEELLK